MYRDLTRTKLVELAQTDKINQAIANEEGTILKGDLNSPLNNDRHSFGTKLLNVWIEEGYIKLLNNRSTPTKFNMITGKGSL